MLSGPARVVASGFATLLRVFALEGDRLWTLDPVAPERLAPVPGLPHPELVSGRLDRIAGVGDGPILAWGETPSVHRSRGAGGSDERQVPERLSKTIATLWRLPAPAPEVVARVNHRAFAIEVAGDLDRDEWLLPGARVVRSVPELVRHLETGGAKAAGGAWVAKAPLSAAGRHRVIAERPAEVRSEALGRRLENLLKRSGSLLVEPWVPRSADFGCAALVVPGSGEEEELVRIAGVHRTEIDRRGAFAGLEIVPGSDGSGLRDDEQALLQEVTRRTGERLAAAGYVGPFGIDAFRWIDQAGAERFHPLSEINARLTFGWVGLALVDRLSGPLGIGDGARVALRFGRSIPAGPGIVPLLRPGGDGPGAWMRLG